MAQGSEQGRTRNLPSDRQPAGPMRWAVLLPALIGMLVHAPTLANGFVFDDFEAIRDNPVVHGPLDLSSLLHRDFWGRLPGAQGGVGTWRPLAVLTLWFDRHAGGGGPFAFHLTNLLIHGLAVFAFTLALSRHLRDRWTALLAGTTFAVLAVCTEGVASIVARADTLATALAFLAFAALPARGEPIRVGRLALAGLALFAALLCKEAAIAAPAWMLLCVAALERDEGDRDERKRRLIAIAGMSLAVLVAYLALRLPTFGGASSLGRSYNNNPLLGASLSARLFTGLRLLGFSLQLVVMPLQLAPDYSFAEILPSQSLFAGGPLVGLAVLVSMLALAAYLWRRSPATVAGIALFLVPWFAVSNIAVALPTIFAERLLYAPAAGVALLLAVAARALLDRERRMTAITLLVVTLAGNAARSVVRDMDWHDSSTLFSQAVIDTPDCARAWNNLGAARMETHRPALALQALERAVRIAPEWASPWALMGGVLDELGEPERAEAAMRRAIRLDRAHGAAYFNLTVFLARHGRRAEALAVARAGEVARPDDARFHALVRQLATDLTPR